MAIHNGEISLSSHTLLTSGSTTLGTTRPIKCLKCFHAIGVLDRNMLQEKAFGLNIAATESSERAYSFIVHGH